MSKYFFLTIIILNVPSIFCLECKTRWYEESYVCSNVSPDLVLPINESVFSLDIENSRIPLLPKNTSLQLYSSLSTLKLEDLHIEEITVGAFEGLSNLQDLLLGRNKLKKIVAGTFNGLTNLNYLYLTENAITHISDNAFADLKKLKSLDLATNLINIIDTNAFSNLAMLEILDLSQNNLTVLQNDLFKSLENVETIILKENPLKEIHEVMFPRKIEKIYISYTSLNTFDFVISGGRDIAIDLSDGKLEKIDFAKFQTEIRSLDLSNNNFEELIIPENVRYLYLSSNKIKNVIAVSDPGKYVIEDIDLSINQLTTASCYNLSSLHNLDLQKNLIEIVQSSDFTGCSNLKILYLGKNRIETVEKNAFSELKSLKALQLSNNNIKTLDFENYLGLNNLDQFYFDNNQIVYFDVDSLHKTIPKVTDIRMQNPFSCPNLIAIFRKLRWHNIKPRDVTYVKC